MPVVMRLIQLLIPILLPGGPYSDWTEMFTYFAGLFCWVGIPSKVGHKIGRKIGQKIEQAESTGSFFSSSIEFVYLYTSSARLYAVKAYMENGDRVYVAQR